MGILESAYTLKHTPLVFVIVQVYYNSCHIFGVAIVVIIIPFGNAETLLQRRKMRETSAVRR